MDFKMYPLVIQDIRKVYQATDGGHEKVALKSFCLTVKQGEMFGLLGPNGAGKTTLISILTGLYEGDAGEAYIGGINIRGNTSAIH